MTQTETAAFFDTYSAQFDAIYGNRNSLINTTLPQKHEGALSQKPRRLPAGQR
jgi:hypothetical protein